MRRTEFITVKRAAAAIAITALAGCGQAAAGTDAITGKASSLPTRPAAWRTDKIVAGAHGPAFTAVVAIGQSGWAFESPGGSRARPVAWERVRGAWTRQPFPGLRGESVVAAAAYIRNFVWVFTSDRRALWFGAVGWHFSKQFSRSIGSAVAFGSSVWVFGEPFTPGAGLGTWHYSAGKWTKSPTGGGLFGGSALALDSVWAYGAKVIAHWDGVSWTRTSVAGLLPPSTSLCDSRLTGIYAESETSVWAIGTGGCQDQGGPFVLMHYNGSTWSRVALVRRLGAPTTILPDNNGGLWITVTTGFPGASTVVHYLNGKLTSARLPIGPSRLLLFAASTTALINGHGSIVVYAVGFRRDPVTHVADAGVILRYGR